MKNIVIMPKNISSTIFCDGIVARGGKENLSVK